MEDIEKTQEIKVLNKDGKEVAIKLRLREQEKIASTEFTHANENKVTYLAESNKYLQTEIKDDVDYNQISSFTAKMKKFVESVGNARLNVTRIIDEYKSGWMDREKSIVSDIKATVIHLEEKLNTWVHIKSENERKEKERIEKEKNKEIEKIRLFAFITIAQNSSLEQEKTNLSFTFKKTWASLTLAEFHDRIASLSNYSPKVNYDKIINTYLKFECTYLNPDEVQDIIKINFDFSTFENEYKKYALQLRDEYLALKDEKLKELQSSNNELDNLLKLKDLENEQIQQLAQQKANEQISKFESESKIQDKILEKEIEAQVKTQNITSDIKGRTTWICDFGTNTDYNRIISLFIESNPIDKLDFLKTFLIKMGRPEIQGVKYTEIKKSVNRVK